MKVFLISLMVLAIGACSSTKNKVATSPDSIVINSPDQTDNCRFLGVVETRDIENWEQDLKNTAALMGATHIKSQGPNYIGFDEVVSGYTYKCD